MAILKLIKSGIFGFLWILSILTCVLGIGSVLYSIILGITSGLLFLKESEI